MAESEGFEPPDLLQSTVFKTAAFDHSASSPDVVLVNSGPMDHEPDVMESRLYRV